MIPLRLWFVLGSAVAVLALVGGIYWKARHDEAARWKPRLEQAQQATRNAEAVSSALDGLQTQTVVIREKSDHAVRQVQQAPGADTPLAPDRRSILCAALASVRGSDACAPAVDPAKPSGAL